MRAREGNARAIGLAGWNVGLRRSLESAQTQNGGRHYCRPPVAGLRPAWRFRRSARAFWFRRHAPPAPRTASGFAFGHRGRARYPCGPQRRDLRRPARRSGRTRLPRLGPYHRTSLPPVAGRRASSLHGQRLSVSRGRGKTPGTPSLADPPGHRLRGGGLPCAVRYSASILDGFLAAPFHDIGISDWCFCDFSLPHHPLTSWMLSLNPSRAKREMAAAGCG